MATKTKKKWYKVTTKDGRALFAGGFGYDLPTKKGKPGPWMKVTGTLVMCHNGFHVTDKAHVESWVDSSDDVIWAVEVRGIGKSTADKTVVREMRFLRKVGTWDEISGTDEFWKLGELEDELFEADDDFFMAKYDVLGAKASLKDATSRLALTKKAVEKIKAKIKKEKAKIKQKQKTSKIRW